VTSAQSPLALISDIHGNEIALEAALRDIDSSGIGDIVCLGDVASMGPHPVEVLRRVGELECPVVMGNADAFLLNPTVTSGDDEMRKIEELDSWCAEQLSEDDRGFIRSFEATVSVDLGGRELLCYHGSPRSFDEIIRPTTPDDELDEMLEGRSAHVFAGGHVHFQMYRRHRRSIVLNPGSVGMSYSRTLPVEDVGLAPWAEYAVFDRNSLSVSFHRVPYDKMLVADAIERSGMPHSDWLAAEWRGS
jgi:predicted phosphodiesterase